MSHYKKILVLVQRKSNAGYTYQKIQVQLKISSRFLKEKERR